MENKDTNANHANYELAMKKAFENFMNQFIIPEIEMREENNKLPKSFVLNRAQIVFHFGKGNEIRLNEEVQATIKIKYKEGMSKQVGEEVLESDVADIVNIFLTDSDDPNSGHVTIVRMNNQWHMSFDFLYNKALSRKNIKTAIEFIEAADFSFSKKNWSSFIDNLFSATELLAKSILLGHTDSEFQKKASHKAIKSKFNLEAKLGNVTPEIRDTFNKLAKLRNPARYVKADLSINSEEAKRMLDEVKKFLAIVRNLSEKKY